MLKKTAEVPIYGRTVEIRTGPAAGQVGTVVASGAGTVSVKLANGTTVEVDVMAVARTDSA